jgi:predicted amidohydrolase YtcJ
MRVRYSNALLWRGLDDSPTKISFDAVDDVIVELDAHSQPDRIIDLDGAFVMPAFRDGHCHPLFAGREHVGPDVTDSSSLAGIANVIRKYADRYPETMWIDGAAYDRSIAARFHRSELDAIVADRPVVLHGADHHTLWVNSKALELAGLLEAIPIVSTGSVDVDDYGVPTGILREWEAMQLVMKHIPPLTMAQELDALDWAQNTLLAAGVVEVQDAWIDPGMTEVYLESARLGRLNVTTNLSFRADPATWPEDFEYFERMRKEVLALNHPSLKANATKFFVDGVLGSSTASVIDQYIAGPAQHTHGEQVWKVDELIRAASESTKLGYQLHLHAIGDAAVRTALDVIEAVGPIIPAVIAHTELVADSDLTRFAELGVFANFEPLWAREDGQLLTCVPQLGRERLDNMYRMRDLVNAGANISFGSDWPVSNPAPLLGIATAVNRSLPGGVPWTKDQALTAREALNAYTTGVASQLANPELLGSLDLGQPAEFVVLSHNPFELSDEDLFQIRVLGTNAKGRPFIKSN